MPCQPPEKEIQSEFEFFESLSKSTDLACCGPVTPIAFIDPAKQQFLNLISHLDVDEDYLDSFSSILLESGMLVIFMCARHWLKHSQIIATVAHAHDSEELKQLAYLVYRFTCTSNNWDYKEISNYTSVSISSKQEE